MTEPDIRFGNLPENTPQTAHAHLSAVLPWLRVAIAAAKEKVPDGQIGLGILIQRPDGSGEITAAMSCENFAEYLEEVLEDASRWPCARCHGRGEFGGDDGQWHFCSQCAGTGEGKR